MNLPTADIGRVLIHFVPFLFALCFHEYAHGWVAKRKGDRTAELMGRLTLNPVVHADLVGTVALPLMALFFHFPFFGWAKPVPVNERNLKNPKSDMFWIALAGPLSNILLAVVGTVVLVLSYRLGFASEGLVELLRVFLLINLFLAVFNMIPLHPLDGGKVLARFLPHQTNRWLEDNQQMSGMILIGLFALGVLKYLAIPVYFMADQLMAITINLTGFFS